MAGGDKIIKGSSDVKVKPGSSIESKRFADETDEGVKKYEASGKKVNWNTKADVTSKKWWSHAWGGTFNTNEQANDAVRAWIRQTTANGGTSDMASLLDAALKANGGSLPDAYASLATVMGSGTYRDLASRFAGLPGGVEVYYTFIGAFFTSIGQIDLGHAAVIYDAGMATTAHTATAAVDQWFPETFDHKDNSVLFQLKRGGQKFDNYDTGEKGVMIYMAYRGVARIIDFTDHLAKPIATVKSILVNSVKPLVEKDVTAPCPTCKKPHQFLLGTEKVLLEGRRVVVDGQ